MSLFVQFEILMLVLYGVECLVFVPGDAVAVVRATAAQVALSRPWQVLATRRGRVVVAGWAPWDAALVAAPWPIAFDGDRVANRPTHALFDDRAVEAPPGRVVEAGGLEKVGQHERELWVNGELFARCTSPDQAGQAARLLRRWRRADPGQREALLERARRGRFNEDRAARRVAAFRAHAGVAKAVGVLLVLLIFGVLPLVYSRFGLERFWVYLIPVYGGLVAMGALEVDRLYRRFYPRRVGERWKQVFLTIVAPTHAMRLVGELSQGLLWVYHPVVAARVAGSPRQAQDAAREAWLSLEHPRRPVEPDPPAVEAVVAEARARDRRALGDWLARRGFDTQAWNRPPAPSSEASAGYCPRCLAQYTQTDAGCRACGGLGLRPFEAVA